ncbi:hypothetical protein STEG23_009281 [Scotinomys teguina]
MRQAQAAGGQNSTSTTTTRLNRMEEQLVTLGRRGRRSIQSLLEEESLPRTQEQPVTPGRRGPGNNQSPSEEKDPGAASHPQRKRTQEHPDTIGTRYWMPTSKAEMGRHQ